jgi:glycosyltransferase involved in cell wall biosynthesis
MRSLKMTNKKLLFIWNYHYFPFEKGKSRFSDLLEAFVKEGYQVEVVTSSFYHMGKIQRSIEDPKYQSFGYKVHFVREPGYKKNVSFARVRSMNRFNAGVRAYLKKHDLIDVIYVPVPSIKLAAIAEKWCRITKAKCVIDVEDLWPESFQMIIRPKLLYKAFTWPLAIQANKVYRKADAVVTVSETYMNRVGQARKDVFSNAVAPIGADVDYVHSIIDKNSISKPVGEFWISYIGTFGKSYDLRMAIDAVSSLYAQGHTNLAFKLMGSGPEFEEIKSYASGKPGKFEFLGLIPYDQMCQILAGSDVGLNPIVKGSVASLINKVGDYAACGLPVLNTQDCPEYESLLSRFNAGLSSPAGNLGGLIENLKKVIDNPALLAEMRKGAEELSTHYLSRAKSQSDILALIASIYGIKSQK